MPSTATDRLDGLTTSVAVKAPCKAYTTSTITQSGEQTIGGVACVDGDRYLYDVGTSAAGIWVVRTGAHERAKDFDGNRDVVQGTLVGVVGDNSSVTLYRVTNANPITIGTTAIDFAISGVNDSANAVFGAMTSYQNGTVGWALTRGFMVATGLTGDGSADDGASINAMLDLLEADGGGTLVLPWPTTQYLLGTQIRVPNHCRLIGVGGTDPAGNDGSMLLYSGTGDAVVAKNGESPATNVRGVVIEHIGVRLTAAGATGFKIRQARDVLLIGCSVDMGNDGQIGFHLAGSRLVTTATGTSGQFTIVVASATGIVAGLSAYGTGVGTGATVTNVSGTTITLDVANDGAVNGNVGFGFGGVFETVLISPRSYCSTTHGEAVHYKLSGTDNLGQCNANQIISPRAGGAGTGIEVGPSLVNTFSGISFEALSNHYIHCLDGATYNEFSQAYLGDQFSVALTGISNASPAVCTYSGTDYFNNDNPIKFTTTGSLPTGLAVGTVYYVRNVNTSTKTFEVSATVGGASINTSSAGSGAHTARWGGKLMQCDSGSQYNELRKYRAGGGAGEETLELNAAFNQAEHILGDKFIGTSTGRALSVRVQGESYNRIEVRGTGLRFGDGTSEPTHVWPSATVETTDYSSTLGTFTPNIKTGRAKRIRLESGSAGTLTIAAPTNATDGDEMDIQILNNSGGSLALAWNAVFVKNSYFPTSIGSAVRLTMRLRYMDTSWVLIGDYVAM